MHIAKHSGKYIIVIHLAIFLKATISKKNYPYHTPKWKLHKLRVQYRNVVYMTSTLYMLGNNYVWLEAQYRHPITIMLFVFLIF